jgi:hypothetical protein
MLPLQCQHLKTILSSAPWGWPYLILEGKRGRSRARPTVTSDGSELLIVSPHAEEGRVCMELALCSWFSINYVYKSKQAPKQHNTKVTQVPLCSSSSKAFLSPQYCWCEAFPSYCSLGMGVRARREEPSSEVS